MTPVLQFGEFTLDSSGRQLRRGTEPITLPGKAFDLLLYMAQNPGRPLLKSELLSAVWPDSFVEESNLSQNVFLLRKALGGAGNGTIVTLPGRGYQFAVPVSDFAPTHAGGSQKHASEPVTGVSERVTNVSEPDPEPKLVPQQTPTHEPSVVARLHSLDLLGASNTGLEATHARLVYEEETEEHISLWHSPVVVLGSVLGLCALVAAVWLGWERYEDRVGGPPVQVVLADFEGGTGDAILDRSLVDALRIDLVQSPFVSVVSAATVRRTLGEMMHKPDEPLTATLARDLCERTASQAVLHGSVARSGAHFLITEEATSCVDGSTIAAAKQDAASRESIPQSIDRLAASLRHNLGESRRTVARFSAPLFPMKTGSIEALEAFSQATVLAQHGKMPEAIALLKRAVDLDPNFTAAWSDLATFSANAGDKASERVYIQKAYDLRESATEPVRLYITAHYHSAITEDLYESLRTYQLWTNLYPRSFGAWTGLAEIERQLGHNAECVAALERAFTLNRSYIILYYGLGLAQLRNGDAKAARMATDLALTRGFDGDLVRGVLVRIAYYTHDANLLAEQEAWSDKHPEAYYVPASLAEIAQAEGRVLDAHRLYTRMVDSMHQQGLEKVATSYLQASAEIWASIGQQDDARNALHTGPIDPGMHQQLVGLVETGDSAAALNLLHAQLARHPTATLWNQCYAPLLRAEVAYRAHKPQEAIAALEATRPFNGLAVDYGYLRGLAYLDAGDSARAAGEFRDVIAHQYVDPLASQVPLAWLNLGRALARGNNPHEAADAYAHFLSIWAHANGDPPLLEEARREAAALPR